VQIRDGLHVLGQTPTGEARVNLVLAMLRAAQMWGGTSGALPGLRTALGLRDDSDADTVDAIERQAHELVTAMEANEWRTTCPHCGAEDLRCSACGVSDDVAAVLEFAATEIVPRLAGTAAEIDQVLHALDGGFIEPGPSG